MYVYMYVYITLVLSQMIVLGTVAHTHNSSPEVQGRKPKNQGFKPCFSCTINSGPAGLHKTLAQKTKTIQ